MAAVFCMTPLLTTALPGWDTMQQKGRDDPSFAQLATDVVMGGGGFCCCTWLTTSITTMFYEIGQAPKVLVQRRRVPNMGTSVNIFWHTPRFAFGIQLMLGRPWFPYAGEQRGNGLACLWCRQSEGLRTRTRQRHGCVLCLCCSTAPREPSKVSGVVLTEVDFPFHRVRVYLLPFR